MAERSAWRFFGSGPAAAPPLAQVLKRALARGLREWATGVLEPETAEGATAPSSDAPRRPPAAPAPRDEGAPLVSDGDGAPSAWLDYVRARAPHLVVGGTFRSSRPAELAAAPLQYEPPPGGAAEVEGAPRGERAAPRLPVLAEPPASSDSRAATAPRAPLAARPQEQPPGPARAETVVWPRGRRFPGAAATRRTNDRAKVTPQTAAAPVVVDTTRSAAARPADRGARPPAGPTPDDGVTARATPFDPFDALADRPRLRAAAVPAAPASEQRARRSADGTAAAATAGRAGETGAIATDPRPVGSPGPAAARDRPRAPAAQQPAWSAPRHEGPSFAWPALANPDGAPAIRTRHTPALPAAPQARSAPAPSERHGSSLEARALWPALPPLALSALDDGASDLEARERRERLRREQVGAP